MSRGTTPAQTVGPFLSLGARWLDGGEVVPASAPGAILVTGTLLDGAGEPVPDGMIETWQADPDGNYPNGADPGDFGGFGRSLTDERGRWRIRTVKPGRVPRADGAAQAPHLEVSIFARGLLSRVVTRIYFADEPEANAADPLLAGLDERTRSTLIAERTADGYAIEFHLQGDDETAFLAI